MKVDVTITLEIDEPDLGKRERYARKLMEEHMERLGDNLIEEYAVREKPIVRTAKADRELGN